MGTDRADSVLPVTKSFPLIPDFLVEAPTTAVEAEGFKLPLDFGEAFSIDNSLVLFGLLPDLETALEDCLVGAAEVFTGLALDLVEGTVVETGLAVFFLGASVAILSVVEDFNPSLHSSFLGDAVFFTVDPCRVTAVSIKDD